ncbi:MAG TPA: peptidase S10 [Casimicrobiaceae bacterium]|jgi:carboxypeptidase C (cathepsin A)|nr:peptidase S10 [Casimicrobiaceae bacterium]
MSEPTPAAAPTEEAKEAKKRLREKVEKLLAKDACKSAGSIVLNGRTLKYRAEAAFVPVAAGGLDEKRGEPEAAVFTTSYLLDDAQATKRPVCFVFNGGPGSASIWLHLGALGPKRVAIREDGTMPEPPYTVVDNADSWFEHFDLVFVDPPHTGYSITVSEEARKKMLSVDGDVDALAECIRAWLVRHRRWGSALYLAGESYGTTRVAALSDKLQQLGVALSGLVLVSCAMDLQSIVFSPRNDLPYALFLPGFACVAQYHGKLSGAIGESPAASRAAAENFVNEDYVAALHAGARLSNGTRRKIVKRVAELTGLPAALVEEKNLRISDQTFFFDLLRDRGQIVGRLEARVTGPMAASRTREWEFDPGIEAIAAPYTMAAHAYMSEQLGVDIPERYEVLNMEAHKAWNWNRGEEKGNGFASTSNDLSRALRRNPHLRVLVASGHYDLGTPYSATDWSLAQLDVPAEVMSRVQHHYYDAGHMMYTRETDMRKLKRDVATWLAG